MAEEGGGGEEGSALDKMKKAASLAAVVSSVEKGSAAAAPDSVMVAVRCRPMNSREISQNEAKIVVVKPDGYLGIENPQEQGNPCREFSFDYTYDDDSVQPTVYRNLGAPLLEKAFHGWNGTIFAYGQTGAGKSFSMTGSPTQPGIIRQMNEEMFGRIAAIVADEPSKKFLVTVSFMEIYNEVLYDLLDPTGQRGTHKTKKDSNIEVKEHPTLGVYVQGLQEIAVDTHEKIQSLMDQGNEMRAVASTQMNATSSRSHSIFIIKMQQKQVVAGQQKETRATINLVDLAGSERVAKTGATGDKLKEGANINKSLSALGNVINALAEQSKKNKKVFIPYRNSKLTRVLQESLGGNSVTVMLAAISPAAYNYEESLNTLQYADRAKAIQLKARKNESMTEVGKLKKEIEELRALLASGGGGGGGGGGDGALSAEQEAQMKAQIDDYNLMLKQSFEEKERLSQEMEQERQVLMQQREAERVELQQKYEAERRQMLESDSDQWVRLLLQSSKQAAQHAEFAARMEALDARRKQAGDVVKEQASFIAVLQTALEKEAAQFVRQDRAREAAEQADPEKAKAEQDDLGAKTLLEQMLLKMKNLREELTKNGGLREQLLGGLDEMGAAASQQLELVRDEQRALDPGSEEARVAGAVASDLELFVGQSAKHRARVAAPRELGRALGPLKEVAASVERGVRAELDVVARRLEAAGDDVDEAQRQGMEKRVQVLRKELHVLKDVTGRDEVAKVLHGLSQVVQGVVVRASKRMTMRDKAKDKSLAAKEQQVREMRAEAEQMREALFKENIALKEERAGLVSRTGELEAAVAARDQTIVQFEQSMVARDSSIVQLQRQLEAMARASPEAAAAAAAAPPVAPLPPPPQRPMPVDGVAEAPPPPPPVAPFSAAPFPAGGEAPLGSAREAELLAHVARLEQQLAAAGAAAPPPQPAAAAVAVGAAAPAGGTPAAVAVVAPVAVAPAAQRPQPAFTLTNESGAAAVARMGTALTNEIGGLSGEAAREVEQMQSRLGAAGAQLKSLDTALSQMRAAATHAQEEKARLERDELAPLRARAEALEEQLRRLGEQPPPPLPPPPPPPPPPPAAAAGAAALAAAPPPPPIEEVTIEVPEGVVPGQQLQVTAPSGQQVTLTVPDNVVPGQQLQVEVPAAVPWTPPPAPMAQPPPVAEEITVEVPEGVVAGQQLQVTAPNGQQVTLTVPEGVVAGQQLQVEVPAAQTAATAEEIAAVKAQLAQLQAQNAQLRQQIASGPAATVAEEMAFEVPEGVVPGQQLQVTAPNGQQVTLTVPEGVVAGQQLQVEVPAATVDEAPGLDAAPPTPTAAAAAPRVSARVSGAAGVDRVEVAPPLEGRAAAAEAVSEEDPALKEAQLAELNEALKARDAEAAALRQQLAEAQHAKASEAVGEDVSVVHGQLAHAHEEVAELQRALRAAQQEAEASRREGANAVRDERLKTEQARLDGEKAASSLREERLHLKEAALTAEETALEAQEEMEALREQAEEARQALAQAQLEAEMQAQLKEEMRAAMDAEEPPESAEAQPNDEFGARPADPKNNAELQSRCEQLEAAVGERQAELEAAEEEKYMMSNDLEVLQEELEDANAHQKRYYEALMAKEEQMRQLKGQCAALQKAVERLQYESELKELRNNPVGEELGGDEAFEQIEQLQKQTHAKDRELGKLKRELERMQTSIIDEDDELDQMSGGIGGGRRGSGFGGGGGDDDDDYSSVPGGGEATYGQQQLRRAEAEESRRADGNAALRHERERVHQLQAQNEQTRAQMQQRLQQAEARAADAATRAHQLEAKTKQQEREILQLIAAKDAAMHGGGRGDDAVGELEDNLYEVNQKLEEELERAAELEKEKAALAEQMQQAHLAAQHNSAALREAQQELEDERASRQRAEKQLAQALGHG